VASTKPRSSEREAKSAGVKPGAEANLPIGFVTTFYLAQTVAKPGAEHAVDEYRHAYEAWCVEKRFEPVGTQTFRKESRRYFQSEPIKGKRGKLKNRFIYRDRAIKPDAIPAEEDETAAAAKAEQKPDFEAEVARLAEMPRTNGHVNGKALKSNITVKRTPVLDPKKPTIIAEPGELASVVDKAMRILAEKEVEIFQRGEKLIRPAIGKGIDSKERPVQFPILIEVDQAFMRMTLSRHIDWFKPDGRVKNGEMPGFRKIDAPDYIAKAIMSNAGNWPFRTLVGIISTPTLRHDGSILSNPGYDPRTHMYLQTSVRLPQMSEHPAKDMAERSLRFLEDLLSEFPFVNKASKSVALSAMLSAVARGMFDVVPAHGARAPAAGTGKSYIFDIVSAIISGERCPVISASSDHDGETEKRIITAAISGRSIINIDNVNGILGGDALCQLIERQICLLRVLGMSKDVRVENRSIVFFNGNNVHVHGDMTRRVILAELDARLERPAEREFKGDPVAKVMAERGKYIAACMTVLRAYLSEGRPKQKFTPMNSFGEWSDTVRSALVWLGRADPCETIAKVRTEDPELQRLSAFIAAAKVHFDGIDKAKSARDIANLGAKLDGYGPAHPELNSVVMEFADRGNVINFRSFGKWLSKFKGRVVEGLCINSVYDKKAKIERWFIETVADDLAGLRGSAGLVASYAGENCNEDGGAGAIPIEAPEKNHVKPRNPAALCDDGCSDWDCEVAS
jgi:putative DNA primase/helicase